ncbi:MAG TPA: response regulator [Opitutaceae bacterium]|nr:response regulator [Opitutaceae bacterium]
MKPPLHILIADDDLDKRLLLNTVISRQLRTASIFECDSGKEALDYFLSNRVDVIVSDHNMFPVDGIQLVKEIRKWGSNIPFIMVTGHDELKARAEAAGVDLFVSTADTLQIGKVIADLLATRGISA